jgi:hypothetical protein
MPTLSEMQETVDFFNELNSCIYDVDAMESDFNNNNFEITNDIEKYRYTNIVLTSVVNGQITQAKQQAAAAGLQIRDFDTGEHNVSLTTLSKIFD